MNQPSSPKRFHHGLYEVHLPVSDLDRAIDFYVTKLEFVLGFGGRGGSSALLMYTDGHTQWMLGLFYRPLSEWRTLVGKVVAPPEIAGPTP